MKILPHLAALILAGVVLLVLVIPAAGQDLARGAQLYDRWYAVLGTPPPADDMPLWARQSSNTRSGPETWRCVECHGWDYRGASGAYGAGSHYTGFPGLLTLAPALSVEDIVSHLKGEKDPGHNYAAYLSEADMLALASFLKGGLIDDREYIDPLTLRVRGGDLENGRRLYDGLCVNCHGADGTRLVMRSDGMDEYLGTIATRDPWRFLHRVRFGVAGTDMPAGVNLGWTPADARDVLLYAQTLPADLKPAQPPASTVARPSQQIGGPATNLWTGILTGVAAFLGTLSGSLVFIALLLGVGVLVVGLLRRRRR